uniref:Uncharacterized protein n=1 Tax=Salix viminalis TaxID=40686 RepID=A0A6N2KYD3_SALVM
MTSDLYFELHCRILLNQSLKLFHQMVFWHELLCHGWFRRKHLACIVLEEFLQMIRDWERQYQPLRLYSRKELLVIEWMLWLLRKKSVRP